MYNNTRDPNYVRQLQDVRTANTNDGSYPKEANHTGLFIEFASSKVFEDELDRVNAYEISQSLKLLNDVA